MTIVIKQVLVLQPIIGPDIVKDTEEKVQDDSEKVKGG